MKPLSELSGTELEVYAAKLGIKRWRKWFWHESDEELRARIVVAEGE